MRLKLSLPKIKLSGVIFLFGLYIKQFYLRESGSIQIGDVVIALSVLMIFFSGQVKPGENSLLAIFVFCTFIINGIYSIYYGKNFLKSSVYLLYNLLVVLAFRLLIREDGFIKVLILLLKICLTTQLFVFITGIGRNYSSLRYQGSFNDPNQFGFFVLCCFFMLFLCYLHFGKRPHILWLLVTGFLVVLSSSRGMMLTFAVFLFLAVIYPFLSTKSIVERVVFILLFAIILVFLFVFGDVVSAILQGALGWRRLAYVFGRIQDTASVSSGTGGRLYKLLADRQLVRIIRAPYYFLFGCGEGYFDRFLISSGQNNEIHCSMIALCYYYGIIPYYFFLKWIRENIKGIPHSAISVFVALIMEAFTLANHRQPLFWMMFAFGSLLSEDKNCINNCCSRESL